MASTFIHTLSHPKPLHQNYHLHSVQTSVSVSVSPIIIHKKYQNPERTHFSTIKCTSSSSASKPHNNDATAAAAAAAADDDDDDSTFPTPKATTLNNAETFPIEKTRRSEILRERRLKRGLVKPEPPNFEIGWKRTKEIKIEKPVGYVIMDLLEKLEGLMGREFGSTALLAKAGEIVAERAREEAEVLKDDGKVEERMVTELFRVLRLMEMDLAMVKAAVKEETLSERLEQAKARCRQAILVAKSF